METVRLKSRVGPFAVTLRDTSDGYEKRVYEWTQDNDFRVSMLRKDWELLEHELLDRKNNIRYKDVIIEL